MAFELETIEREADEVSLHSPVPLDVAIAAVNDCFRMAGTSPVDDATWRHWARETGEYWAEQMGMIAHLLAATSLRAPTVEALRAATDDRRPSLRRFFDRIAPLTAEMIRSNEFRREECLRRWVEWCGGTFAGESAETSEERLERLDYRETLEEYERADAAREQEREERIEAAKEQDTAARGWRE
ncbi:MAG: hypothetical protein ABEN55_14865 [Bradymonadaceae bacterium]